MMQLDFNTITKGVKIILEEVQKNTMSPELAAKRMIWYLKPSQNQESLNDKFDQFKSLIKVEDHIKKTPLVNSQYVFQKDYTSLNKGVIELKIPDTKESRKIFIEILPIKVIESLQQSLDQP